MIPSVITSLLPPAPTRSSRNGHGQELAHDGGYSCAQCPPLAIGKVSATDRTLRDQQGVRHLWHRQDDSQPSTALVQPLRRTLADCLLSVLTHYTLAPLGKLFSQENYQAMSAGISSFIPLRDPLVFPGASAQPLPFFDSDDNTMRSLQQANNRVIRLLKRKYILLAAPGNAVPTHDLINLALGFSFKGNKALRYLVRQIQRGRGLYGGHRGETLSLSAQQQILQSWISENIFGGPVEKLLFKQLGSDAHAREMRIADLRQFLQGRLDAGLTSTMRAWIWQHVVCTAMPMLCCSAADTTDTPQCARQEELQIVDLAWGKIHAGLLFAKRFRLGPDALPMEQASGLGKMLLAELNEHRVPARWHHFFRLPAMLRYAIDGHSEREAQLFSSTDYASAHERYLAETCPASKFKDRMAAFQTRSQLASKVIAEHCPDMPVERYLDFSPGGEVFCREKNQFFALVDVTQQYQIQVDETAQAFHTFDALLLLAGWSGLPEEEIAFITSAEVNKMQASFSAAHLLNKVLAGANHAARQHLIHHPPAGVQLFGARATVAGTQQSEERIYVMQKCSTGYHLKRIDRHRIAYYALLEEKYRKRVQHVDYRFQVVALSEGGMKQSGQPWTQLIDMIAGQHRQDFSRQLYAYGYDKTSQEKMVDFALSFIPLYTCVTALKDGRAEDAAWACSIDVVSFIPVLARLASLSIKFGQLLTQGSLLTFQHATAELAAREAIRTVLKHSGRDFMQHAMLPASRMLGSQEVVALQLALLRAIDPGFELAGSIGRVSLGRALRLGRHMQNHIPALKNILPRLHEALRKMPRPLAKTGYQMARLRGIDRAVPVVQLAGGQAPGKRAIYVKIDPDTGDAFGRKYTLSGDGVLIPVPISLARRLKNIRQQGLGGKDPALKAQQWELDQSSSKRMTPHLLREISQWGPEGIMQLGGLAGAAQAYDLSLSTLRRYFNEDGGMTEAAKDMLERAEAGPSRREPTVTLAPVDTAVLPLTTVLIPRRNNRRRRLPDLSDFSDWAGLSPVQRAQITRRRFALQRNINPETWASLVELTGEPTLLGRIRYGFNDPAINPYPYPYTYPYQRVPNLEDLRLWRELTIELRRKIPLREFARSRGMSPSRWSRWVRVDGSLTEYGKRWFARTARIEEFTQPQVRVGTKEEDPGGTYRMVKFGDNRAMRLEEQDGFFSPSGGGAALVDAIEIINWHRFEDTFKNLPLRKRLMVKEKILTDVKLWLGQEADHMARFNTLMYTRPTTQANAPMGALYAATALPCHTVLGPYFGKIDSSEQQLSAQFSVAPQTADTLSANVGIFEVTGDIKFFATITEIKAHDELVLSYADAHNALGISRATTILIAPRQNAPGPV